MRFPICIKRGSTVVKVYRVRHRSTASGFVYAVSYNVGPRRFLPQFAELDRALDEARQRAELLTLGRNESAAFSRADAEELRAARKLAGETPLLSALQEWQRARELSGGNILPAAELWKGRNLSTITRRTVSKVVDEFTAARKRAGFDVAKNHASIFREIKERLGELVIDTVTARQLGAYLERLKNGSSRNTHRKRIVAIWRWAKKQGYLPRDTITEAEQTERAREEEVNVGIIAPPKLATLLERHRGDPELLASLVLAALCGLRRAEVHEQTWEDIDLGNRVLRVSKAKRGTPSRRMVPLSDAAVDWLLLCGNRKGRITQMLSVDRIRLLARDAGDELPENCFRHSFISHRVAQTGSIHETSLEAGNSPDVIRRHYLELVTKAQGAAWFAVFPHTAQNAATPLTA